MTIMSREEVSTWIAEKKRLDPSCTIGFTSGTFDLLHQGHLDSLKEAKENCSCLVVGVNSDNSVRRYKGPRRPVQKESGRVSLVSELKPVDIAFLFDDFNNTQNLLALRPHLYFKGEEYRTRGLSTYKICQELGIKIVFTSYREGSSTTSLISKVADITDPFLLDVTSTPLTTVSGRGVVFLDRDGTIIRHVDYLSDPKEVELLPHAVNGLRKLKDAGFALVMVTNQPGLGTGLVTRGEFIQVTKHLLSLLYPYKVTFDKILFCPHSLASNCRCRKPEIELYKNAHLQLKFEESSSYVIGDMTSDLEFARRSGCKSVLVTTGYGGRDGRYSNECDYQASHLEEAANWILSNEQKKQRATLAPTAHGIL
jgi:rfaE bifunctional protein nucleotidyltransferase chain/domain